MPSHKKHHYVPRFYLKFFSKDGKSINLWNKNKKLHIACAPLKNQAYQDYLYGKEDQLEKGLGVLEADAAAILRNIVKLGIMPPHFHDDYETLLFYLCIQHARTSYYSDTLDEITNNIIQSVHSSQLAKEGINLSDFIVTLANPSHIAIQKLTESYPLIFDLEARLLINQTAKELVTSDVPVIFYNQLLEFRTEVSNTGLQSKGLQIFFPISPTHMILLYDKSSYSVKSAKDSRTLVLTTEKDIYQLNRLQLCSSYENIYFKSKNTFDLKNFVKSEPFFRDKKSTLSKFGKLDTPKKKSEFIGIMAEDIRTNLSLSFINKTRKARAVAMGLKKSSSQPVVIPRNLTLLSLVEEFREEIEAGHFTHGDFKLFAKSRGALRNNTSL